MNEKILVIDDEIKRLDTEKSDTNLSANQN